MKNQKFYIVIEDLQGQAFGFYRVWTAEQWRNQAIAWSQDEETTKHLRKLPKSKIINFISEYWNLTFREVSTDKVLISKNSQNNVILAEIDTDFNLVIVTEYKNKEPIAKNTITNQEFARMWELEKYRRQ